MAIEIKVPQLPESVADATLVTWHKQVGQAVSRDENLADLETDKVVLEVPAPVNGVLKELKIVAGTSVTSGQVLAAGTRLSKARARAKVSPCLASIDTSNQSLRTSIRVSSTTRFGRGRRARKSAMLANGVDIMGAPGGLVSAVHGPEDVARTLEAFRTSVRWMKTEHPDLSKFD